MKNIGLALVIASMTTVGFTAMGQNTQKFTASKANEYGLVYSLPNTAVEITIQTVHTKRVPGEFYNYARRHLAINDAITKPSTTVEIGSVNINTRGVANPDNRWLVQFKSGSTPFVILDGNDIPLAVNTETVEESKNPELSAAQAMQPSILETEFARQAMTQEMISSSSISKRAKLAADRIFELRDMRSELLSGQADNPPADGQAMKLVLDNLARQEEALTAMFAGTEQTWTTVRTITIVPDSTGLDGKVIARISPFEGVIDADNLAGEPLTVDVEVIEAGKLPVNDKGETKRFPKGGFAYQIPGTAKVVINYEGKEIASAGVTLAQLGVTFGLDPGLFTDKKAPSQLRLDPATGGILLLGPADRP